MKKGLLLITVFLLGLFAFSFVCNAADKDEFTTVGVGQIIGGDSSAARGEALNDALREAVKMASENLLSADDLQKNSEKISATIFDNASQYVSRHVITNEGPEGDSYKVYARVFIDVKKLQEDLGQFSGPVSGAAASKKVMVLIDEYFKPDMTINEKPRISEKYFNLKDEHSLNASSSESESLKHSASKSSNLNKNKKYVDKSAASVYANAKAKGETDSSGKSRGSFDARGEEGNLSASGSESSNYKNKSLANATLDARAKNDIDFREKIKKSAGAKSSLNYKGQANSSLAEKSNFEVTAYENYFPPAYTQPLSNPLTVNTVEGVLGSYNIRLVDKAMTDKLRAEEMGENGYMVNFLQDKDKVAQMALKAGAEYGADIFVIGAANTVLVKPAADDTSGSHEVFTTITLKAVDASTGDILGSMMEGQPSVGYSNGEAYTLGSERVGKLAGDELASQIMTYWKNRDVSGAFITLNVYGIKSARTIVRLKKILEGIPDVVSVNERLFDADNGRSEFNVGFKGKCSDLEEKIFDATTSDPELSKLDTQEKKGNSLDMVLK